MSSPESVSSSTARRGSSSAIWRISLRFFSPPENPSFRCRSAKAGSMPSRSIHSVMATRTSSTERSSPLRADTAWRRNWMTETPVISSGYWKARNSPPWPARRAARRVMSSPSKADGPSVTVVAGVAQQRVAEGGLAGAVGTHEGVDLTGRPTCEVHAPQDSVPSRRDVEVARSRAGGVRLWSPRDRVSARIYTTPDGVIPGTPGRPGGRLTSPVRPTRRGWGPRCPRSWSPRGRAGRWCRRRTGQKNRRRRWSG